MVCIYWVNTNLSVSDKAGIQAVYGYKDTDDNDRYMSMFDSRLLTANQNGTSVAVSDTDAANNRYFVSAPLICNILTSSEKLLPSFLMPQIRQQFTVDSLPIHKFCYGCPTNDNESF